MYIQLTNVSKKIKSNDILKDINLRMESGKIYGFKGKNGCGKTMLMRAISGLIKVKGTVDINGQIIGKDIMFPPSIGLLIENPSFINNYTAFENLKTLASIRRRIDDNRIRETLTEIGLDTDDKRTITIGSRNYVFKCFHHDFTIVDEATLEERMNWSRVISADQKSYFLFLSFQLRKIIISLYIAGFPQNIRLEYLLRLMHLSH